MSCPPLEELVGGAGAEHAAGCPGCRAILELAATRAGSDRCGLMEGLLAARTAGALTPASEITLLRHLASCASCARLARALDSPTLDWLSDDLSELQEVAREQYGRGRELGRGGMGRVILARDRRLGRTVALKELLDPGLAARFEREARLAARLQHPAIVSVIEAGRWPGGAPFYTMEYVAGRPLDRLIAERSTLAERLALLAQFTTVVEAIAYAHSERVLHRDLKPANIMVGAFGETVVVDWGLATELIDVEPSEPGRDPSGDALSSVGAGTPAYMAPEQARGDALDEGADIFALGATLHHLLAGRPPGQAELPDETPAELRAVVAKAMKPARADRYESAAELAAELRRFQTGQLVRAHRYSAAALARRWLRRHRSGLLGLGAVAAAIALFVVARRTAAPGCDAGDDRLAGVWDAAVRASVERSFLASGRSDAASVFGRVASGLDDYVGAWKAAHRDTCEATVVRHEQSEALFDLRMQCLDRRVAALRALTGLLARDMEAARLDRAVLAAGRLDDVSACSDATALVSALPPPAEPSARVEVASIRALLHEVRALDLAARFRSALALVTPVVEEANALAYAPAQLDAYLELDAVQRDMGDWKGEAVTLARVLDAAARSKDDARVARAWSRLMFATTRLGRPDEALAMQRPAELALARAETDPQLRGGLLFSVGVAHEAKDELVEAEASLREAVAVLAPAPNPVESIGPALNGLGIVLMERHENVEALATYEAARRTFARVLGEEHPRAQSVLGNEANLFMGQGRYAEALAIYETQLARAERSMGDGPGLVSPLHNVALADTKLGRYAEAEPLLVHDLALREAAFGPESDELLEPLRLLGEARAYQGKVAEVAAPLDRARVIAAKRGIDSKAYTSVLDSDALVAQLRGDCAQTIAIARRALEIDAHRQGQKSYDPALRLGQCQLAVGHPREALAPLEHVLGAVGDGDAADAAEAAFALGRARFALNRHDPTSIALTLNARITFSAGGPVQRARAADVDRWLAASR